MVLLSVLSPNPGLGLDLQCSWIVARPWFKTYQEALDFAAVSPIRSDGVIALIEGDPSRPMKLKRQSVDVMYSPAKRCMELEGRYTAPPSCQWPARPLRWMLALDRQQGWAGVHSVSIDSPYIEQRADRDSSNSVKIGIQAVMASRHSDYRAGSQVVRPRAEPKKAAKPGKQQRLLETTLAGLIRSKLAEWILTLPRGATVINVGCGSCRDADLYPAAGMNMLLIDGEMGQLEQGLAQAGQDGHRAGDPAVHSLRPLEPEARKLLVPH